MNKRELYEFLDIETPEDFQYFENLASFMECEEELNFDDVAELFEQVDKETLAQLIGDYFEEATEFVPGSETEVFSIMDNVSRALIGLCREARGDDTQIAKLCEELDRFRRWYSMESKAYCTDLATMNERKTTLRDALLLSRTEKIEGKNYQYDFCECTDYPLDEYIVSLGDMVAAQMKEDEAALAQETRTYEDLGNE